MEKLKIKESLGKAIIILLLLSITAPGLASDTTKPASVLLQEGLYAEEVEGDIDAAIKIYQQIIDDDSAQRNYIAQAIYRQGMCYLKLQNENQAQGNFRKLVADFSDQTGIIAKVKPLLYESADTDPAKLMPPDTLFYIELGKPGQQIETIENILRGSPLEDPSSLLANNTNALQVQISGQNVVQMFSEPLMMAEFDKIKSVAMGITDFSQNSYMAGVIVISIGESEMLKNTLKTVLNLSCEPIESIEGMNCFQFNPGSLMYLGFTTFSVSGALAAYDDSTFIFADEAVLFEWCIKQYKGITSEPSLASGNESFSKLSQETRQSNAITIWTDADTAYATIPGDFFLAPQIRMVNRIADFESIDDISASLSIHEKGLSFETSITLNEDHNNFVYNLINTPNLNYEGFKAIPSESVAVLSFALNDSENTWSKLEDSQLINNFVLNLAKEFSANIEQITLFLLPPRVSSLQNNEQVLSLASSLGIVISCRNPQQTQQVIDRILSAGSIFGLVSKDSIDKSIVNDNGKNTVELNNGLQLNYYQNPSKGTVVLSLNSEILDASIASLQSPDVAIATGPLQKPFSVISDNTTKSFMLNIGGFMHILKVMSTNREFMEILGDYIHDARYMVRGNIEQRTEVLHQLLDKFAEIFKDTTIQIETNESQNNLFIQAGLNELPPGNRVSEPITEFVNAITPIVERDLINDFIRRYPPMSETAIRHRSTVITQTDTPAVIDGFAEPTWSTTNQELFGGRINDLFRTTQDKAISAEYRAMWDKENLYIHVKVNDDLLQSDSADFYQDDSIEIFIDADNSKSAEYDDNDYHFFFKWNKDEPVIGLASGKNIPDGIQYKLVSIGANSGYNLEVMFPWESLGIEVFPGTKIGLDIYVNDDDDGGDRDERITWCDRGDLAWQNPFAFGTADLVGLVGWWKFDETRGDVAADSSGNGNFGKLIGDAKWRPSEGKIGGAIYLDGEGDYVIIANKQNFDITNQITISAWVKTEPVNDNWGTVISKGRAWYIYSGFPDDKFYFQLNNMAPRDPNEFTAGQWHHVVGVFDSNSKNIRTYIDGKYDVSSQPEDIILLNKEMGISDLPVCIGENLQAGGRSWQGFLDDIRIYNYALNEDEILALYNGK